VKAATVAAAPSGPQKGDSVVVVDGKFKGETGILGSVEGSPNSPKFAVVRARPHSCLTPGCCAL